MLICRSIPAVARYRPESSTASDSTGPLWHSSCTTHTRHTTLEQRQGAKAAGSAEVHDVVGVVEVEEEEEEEEERATQRIAALRVACRLCRVPSFHRLHFRNRIPVLATL